MSESAGRNRLTTFLFVADIAGGNGRDELQRALDSYARQNVSDRELIVVDDGTRVFLDDLPDSHEVRYLQIPYADSSLEKRMGYGMAQARGGAVLVWNGRSWVAASAVPPQLEFPLVSCVMPTANRRRFVPQAIRNFQRQTYPARELIVIDDGDDAVGDLIPADPRIHYIRLSGRSSVGAKRNIGCLASRGELLANWDDDDWMAPWRLQYQVEELIRNEADLCGLRRLYFWGPSRAEGWEYEYPAGALPWVAGGTMLFGRSLWMRNAFADIDVGEDNLFVWSDVPKRVLALEDTRFYVAAIHPGNTSPKEPSADCWRPARVDDIQQVIGADWEAYSELIFPSAQPAPDRLPRVSRGRTQSGPLVSCLLSTRDRPRFVRQTIQYFLRQSYRRAELIVVDNGSSDEVEVLCQGMPCVSYARAPLNASLGAKLNLAAAAAKGSVLQKLDDDDYYDPSFLECALAALDSSGSDRAVAAWDCFLVLFAGETELRYSGHGWAAGGTLCFRRSLWERVKFRDIPREVDRWFLNDTAADVRRVCAPERYVLLRHGCNTWTDMYDGGAVDDYFRQLPAAGPTILHLVEPIDRPFYLDLRQSAASRACESDTY